MLQTKRLKFEYVVNLVSILIPSYLYGTGYLMAYMLSRLGSDTICSVLSRVDWIWVRVMGLMIKDVYVMPPTLISGYMIKGAQALYF